jgi:hypothetical protein
VRPRSDRLWAAWPADIFVIDSSLNPPTPGYVLGLAYPSRHRDPTATLATATVPLETPILRPAKDGILTTTRE